MIAFELSVNGTVVRLIGVGDHGMLSVSMNWTGGGGRSDHLFTNVSGLDATADERLR